MTDLAFSHPFNLAALSETARTERLSASAEARARIASWAGVHAVDRFDAAVILTRLGVDHYRYEAQLDVDLVQTSVVSLKPMPVHLSLPVARDFRILPRREVRRGAMELSISDEDEDEDEPLKGEVLDLAGPLLEEFALSVDPYPRAPGETFTPPADKAGNVPDDNPFRVLERLKKPGGEGG